MKVEFQDDKPKDLPKLNVIAENIIEWRALQMYIRLLDKGMVQFYVSYSPTSDSIEVGGSA